MITFYKHQNESFQGVDASWRKGNKNVLLVLPTGAGKTLTKAEIARREIYNEFAHLAQFNTGGKTIIFAHRDVLLHQISEACCLLGLTHTFIAAKHTVKEITNLNLTAFGDSFFDESSDIIIASVDSFRAKYKKGQVDHLIPYISLWLMDEAHHLLLNNKWGQAVNVLVNARGLGVTATPLRADGKGLGRGNVIGHDEDGNALLDNDGVFDDMFVGATMGELIEKGKLSPYRIYAPPSKLDTSDMRVTASGDLNQRELAERTDNNDITGDAIEHYIRIANGLQAIAYCVNIAHSNHVAEQFNLRGIPAKALSSETPIKERQRAIVDFKRGVIKVLVNSDLFGEGFDVPALVVGIMLRKTESYSLFKQQFGRPLRVLEGKEFGIIIDHVNNVRDMMIKYNLKQPHDDPEWTLERVKKRKTQIGDEPVGRVCPDCAAFYIPKGVSHVCPYCEHEETTAESEAAHQEFLYNKGDLVEMDVNFMNELMAKREKVWKDTAVLRHEMSKAPPMVRNGAANNHSKRQYAHSLLTPKIQQWCFDMGVVNNWDIKTVQLEFESEFGINILKAQTLSEREALELLKRINEEYL